MTAPVDVLAVYDDCIEKLEYHYRDTRAGDEMRAGRAAVVELIAAAKEDAEMPSSILIGYWDRQKGEPEGPAWWDFKRAQIQARGYSDGWERSDGSEVYYKDGPTPRLIAALARAGGGN